MKIGLEASYAFMGRGGIDRYAHDLIGALLARRDHDYVVFTMFAPFRHAGLDGAPLGSVVRRKLAMGQVEGLRRMWSGLSWPPVEWFTGAVDVFHSIHHFAVPVRGARVVATIHDLSFEHPELAIEKAALYARDARRMAHRADMIIAVSEFTRAELMSLYGVPGDRVRVIPEGVVFERWRGLAASDGRAAAPYFIVVGKVEPRKNLAELVEGFGLARAEFKLPHRLVVVGKTGRQGASILTAIRTSAAASWVDCMQFVPDKKLGDLYRGATALVCPSLYEGFGLPVLEGMAAGVPVVASRAASLPEVVGDAGLLVDPGDARRWAEALGRVAQDSELRASLVERGLRRARQFTWESVAAKTAALYEELGAA